MSVLNVTDNRNETGAFAVTGAIGGGVVYATKFAGETGAISRSSVGTFVGTGGVGTFVLKRGHYLFQAVDSVGPSAIFYLPITSSVEAFATRCREAIASRIRLLNLEGITGVHLHFSPNETVVEYPCVFLHIRDVQETNNTTGSTNGTTDWGHATRVTIAHRVDPRDAAPMPDFESWRQAVRHAFDRQRLPGVSEVKYTEFEPGSVAQPYSTGTDSYLMTGSDFTIRCITREPRGFGQ